MMAVPVPEGEPGVACCPPSLSQASCTGWWSQPNDGALDLPIAAHPSPFNSGQPRPCYCFRTRVGRWWTFV